MRSLGSLLERPGRTLARLIVAITILNMLLIGLALMARPVLAQSTDAALPHPALAIMEKAVGPEHPDMALSSESYAALLRETGRAKEAGEMKPKPSISTQQIGG